MAHHGQVAPPSPDDNIVRVYDHETDAGTIKMLIGQGVLEGLAHANQKVITHPLSILLVLLLGAALDYRLSWLPNPSVPFSFLAPLIGPTTIFLPIICLAEFRHRPAFTRRMRETIGSPDLVSPAKYYSLDPRSKIIVFERKGELGGVVCLDGSRAGEGLGSVLGAEEKELGDEGVMDGVGLDQRGERGGGGKGLRQRTKRGDTSVAKRAQGDMVEIRHLDVDTPLRQAGVATELLVAALDHAFGVVPMTPAGGKGITRPAEKVIFLSNPLLPGGGNTFPKCGFTPVEKDQAERWYQPEKVGMFGWRGRWLGVSRSEYMARREQIFAAHHR